MVECLSCCVSTRAWVLSSALDRGGKRHIIEVFGNFQKFQYIYSIDRNTFVKAASIMRPDMCSPTN